LELALGRRVIDGDVGVVEEPEQRIPVPLVVADGDGQRFGRQERRLDGREPATELRHDGADRLAAVCVERAADEALGVGGLLGDVHRGAHSVVVRKR